MLVSFDHTSNSDDGITKQTWLAHFMQQCVMFSLDSHHVPSVKNYSIGHRISLQNITISGVIFGRGNVL